MRSWTLALLLPFALAGTTCTFPRPPSLTASLQPSSECFEEIAGVLASDRMQGRGVGSEGLEAAARFLEDRYRQLGLDPIAGGYRQPFPVITGVALGDRNALSWGGEAGQVGTDFMPFGFSSSASFDAPLVFAGYGLRARELGYDDYAGMDVEGKVVLAMRYEPGESDPASPFDGRKPTRWSDLRYKAHLAREQGAAALVLVDPPVGEEPDRLPVLKQEGPVSRAGIAVLQVTRSVAERWLATEGLDLRALRGSIDETYAPRSIDLPSVRVQGAVDLVTTEATVSNVIGVLPGRGEAAREVVVVGAHYDHLGVSEHGSLAAGERAIHNGADDNASGVAAMLCGTGGLIRSVGDGHRRTLVVAAFAAEEIGLGGSSWYVRNPPLPLDGTVAMVNLDMVGRLRDGRLSVIGTDSAREWEGLLEGPALEEGLSLSTGGDGYGPSDQTSFYEKEIPVVHLFTGAHLEYHTPEDDVVTLNVQGGSRVAAFLDDLLGELLTRPGRLTYQASISGPTMTGDSRGYGSYLGTIPDYTRIAADEGGVALLDVREGGPAHAAGLRGGDRIVRMAGVEIQNLHDMTFVLRDHRPGEWIDIEYLRDDVPSTVRARLEARPAARGEPPVPEAPPSAPESWSPRAGRDASALLAPGEVHLADLRQLTFGGENAEGYFAPDGRGLIFQRTPPEGGCDQMYALDLDSGDITRLSSGRGRTTCGYYAYPEGDRVIYSTTEGSSPDCPPPPDRSQGYVWALYDYDMVWQSGPDAEADLFLPDPAYDAEATICPRDGRVVFTSSRSGDLELHVVNPDGTDLRQLTHTPGYDGGAFFSADCSAIVWRASRPEGVALEDYRRLLGRGLVRPSALEIFWMDLGSGDVRQLTRNGRANFAPYPLPDSSGVLFSSNLGGDEREFDVYLVRLDGGAPERVTYTEGFDGFPVFSPDGRWLVFASNRAGPAGETNLFIARWVP